jgi:hypothetical protein
MQTETTTERFEVLTGESVMKHQVVVLQGLIEINRRSPMGYPAKDVYERLVEVCNRAERPEWIFLVAVDRGARQSGDESPHSIPAGWVTCWLNFDMMGERVVNIVHAYVRPGYKPLEVIRAMMPAVDVWSKLMGCEKQVTFTGRTDEQRKGNGSCRAYARWIEPLGFRQAETMFERRL